MSVLRQVEPPPLAGLSRPLARRTLIGREPACTVVLAHPRVSRLHAVMEWQEGRWTIRDMSSANGTWVNGWRLAPLEDRDLAPGDRLMFGSNEAGEFVLEPGGPVAFATHLQREVTTCAEGHAIYLGAEDGDQGVVYLQRNGWFFEHGDGIRAVGDGAIVEVDGPWRLHLPEGQPSTVGPEVGRISLHLAQFRFDAAMNLEHVRLCVQQGTRVLDLEERQEWYVLWVLAEQRLHDRLLPAADQGWVDREDLARRTGIRAESLATYVSRARKLLTGAGVDHGAEVVASRGTARRLGVDPGYLDLRVRGAGDQPTMQD